MRTGTTLASETSLPLPLHRGKRGQRGATIASIPEACTPWDTLGTVPIDGTALIQVLAESDEVVAEFQHEIAGLAPGAPITFDDLWDTTAVLEGTYRIVAYVSCAGVATDPALIMVSTEPNRTYLPLIVRDRP